MAIARFLGSPLIVIFALLYKNTLYKYSLLLHQACGDLLGDNLLVFQ